MLILLDHGSRNSESDASIFYNLPGQVAHKLHYFEVIHLLRRETRKLSKENERDASIFDIIFGDFAHKLHFFKGWITR
jgi:hypothetical protein